MVGEEIIHEEVPDEKCPMCNFRTHNTYRLESEDEDVAVCGDCFTTWLLEEGHRVVKANDE